MADETNNKNAVFKFYLNRQGVKGNKGEKGEQGFSPIIEVSENTAASYKLQITTETDQIETPNLRGNAVEDLGGTYMRYNPETQTMYAAPADSATTTSKGEVTLASDEAIANLSNTNVITPAGIVDNATSLFQSSGGSISITQDETTSKINLEANTSGIQGDITMIQAHLSIHDGQIEQNKFNIDTLEGRVDDCEDNILSNTGRIQTLEHNLALDEQAIQNNTLAIANKVDKVAGKGLSTNDFTNEDKDKLTHAVIDTDLANVAFTGSYTDLINTPTAYSGGLGVDINSSNVISVKVDGTTVAYNLNGELTATGGGSITVDQTYDATSANAQSGVAIAGELNNYVKSEVGNYHIMNTGGDIQLGYADDNDNPTKAAVIGISEQQGIIIGALDGETDPTNPKMFSMGVIPDGLVFTNDVTQQNAILNVSNNNLAVNGVEVQPKLVSGTNIKTINNESILGSGNIDIQASNVDQVFDGTSANAQSGVAIAGAGFLNNSATQSTSLAIKATTAPTTYTSTILNGQSVTGNGGTAIGYGTRAVYTSTALGANSYGQGNGSTAIGNNATSTGIRSLAIGGYNADTMGKAHADAQDAIQIGIGQNSTASSLAIGFNGTNYQLLDGTTGLIPAARIPVDGSTITVNASGQLVSSGGGGGTPTNMMTTDTVQNVTAQKNFLQQNIKYFDDNVSTTGNSMWIGKAGNGDMGLIFDSAYSGQPFYIAGQGYTNAKLNVKGFENFKIDGDTENRRCYIANANIDKGSNPSSTEYIGLLFDDSDGREGEMSDWVQHRLGNVEVSLDSSGTTTMAIDAYRNYGYYPEGMESTSLKLVIDSSGNKTATIGTGNFSRTDGTNIYKILDESDNTKFDGQYVTVNATIADGSALPTTTPLQYDLSSYLPNDSNDYEILLWGRVTAGTAIGDRATLNIATSIANGRICDTVTRVVNGAAVAAGCVTLPVPSNRILTVGTVYDNTGTFFLRLVTYRRIGTNA